MIKTVIGRLDIQGARQPEAVLTISYREIASFQFH